MLDYFQVRYDVRGHGRSGKPPSIEGHASSLYADDFEAVIRGFKLKKPVVVGWSVLFFLMTVVYMRSRYLHIP